MPVRKWVDIPGYNGKYRISPGGRVQTRIECYRRGNKVKWITMPCWQDARLKVGRGGYITVRIYGKRKRLHVLMLEVFVGPRPIIDGRPALARHLNDVRADNRIENLAWGTQAQNIEDGRRNGGMYRGSRHHLTSLTEKRVGKIRRMYSSGKYLQRELAERFGVSRGVIHGILHGNSWKHVEQGTLPATSLLRKKKRIARGETCPTAKLTEENIREIRRLVKGGVCQYEVAIQFKVSKMCISNIIRGKTWECVK